MAKEAGDKKSVAPLTLPQEPIEGRENLDKIRDLLFGPQVRTFNQRFSRLEDRLVREMGDLRDEVRKRVDSLESFMKSEFHALTTRITSEQDKRAEAVKQLKTDLRETVESFEEKIARLDNTLEEKTKDLREQLLSQSKQLTNEILEKHEEALRVIRGATDQIRLDHADRSNLSKLFTELAVRLDAGLARDIIPGLEEKPNE